MIQTQNSKNWESIEDQVITVYEYFDEYAAEREPEEVINEFRCLFVQAKCESPKVSKALEKITASPVGQQKFTLIFNYCIHIILDLWSQIAPHDNDEVSYDRWVTESELSDYINQLITVIEGINSQVKSYDRRKAKQAELLGNYQQTELYLNLKSLVTIITSERPRELDKSAKVQSLIKRYTYLYKYFLVEDDNITELETLIDTIRQENQKSFELELSKHIIYRTRLKQVTSLNLLSKGAGKVITRVKNPTLLSERSITAAIKQFVGLIDGKNTLLQLSQKFIARSKVHYSYREYKQDLYQYLISNLTPRTGNSQFQSKLKQKIENIFLQANSRQINNTLILQTCRQLLSFFVTETTSSPDLNSFAKLVVYLGSAQAVLLLVKIILICPEAQPDLEKKLAILFTAYQSREIKDVFWYVKCLEHFLIAHSIYCGEIDVSIAKSI